MHIRNTILTIATLASQILVARAQGITNATCLPAFSWMTNGKGQNPCLVVAYLSSDCANIPWQVSALPAGATTVPYSAPVPPYANECRCNTVAYDLLSACGICQGSIASTWSDWTQNCAASITAVGKYPRTIPSQIDIPGWAYWDPTAHGGTFNATAARRFGESNSGSKTNVGAIIGGVIGGIAGLALIGGLIWWFIRRRKNTKRTVDGDIPASQVPYEQAPYGSPTPQYGGQPQQITPYSVTGTPMRAYDPNDPSIFLVAQAYTPSPNYPPPAQHPYQQPYQQPYGAPHTPGYSGVAEL